MSNENLQTATDSAVKKQSFFATLTKKIRNFFTYNLPGQRLRIWELDLIRGIIMFFVTLDHVCVFSYYWNIITYKTAFGKALESFAVFYLHSYFRKFVEPIGLWSLCFMSGISCQFSRSSVRRSVKFLIITAVFMSGYLALHFIVPDLITGYVIFNIVPIIAISITLWYLVDALKCPMKIRIAVASLLTAAGVVLFFVNRFSANGIYVKNDFLSLLIYNKHGYEVSPNNFEPLLPHLGFFFLGGAFGKYFYKDKTSKLKVKTPPKAITPLMLLGKHSFIAYLFLTPIIIGSVWLIVRFVWLFL